jgi:putative transposase
MSRALRIEFPGALYHAMSRGVARMPVFVDDNDRLLLLHEIESQVQLGFLIVHAFCLMLNHIHLLCETPFAGLSRIMHDILGNYASGFNLIHHRSGHLWQGRYKAILVQDGTCFLQCSKYIHLNPHRAGIDPGFIYPWSSYNDYRSMASFPWVSTNRILSNFPDILKYQAFVEDRVDDCRNPFELATAGIAYGDREFVKYIYSLTKNVEAQEDQPAIRLLQRSVLEPNVEAVRSAVEIAFPGIPACKMRHLLVWALHSYTWLRGSEIAQAVGLKKSAVSKIIHSIQEDLIAIKEIESRIAVATKPGFPQKNQIESALF